MDEKSIILSKMEGSSESEQKYGNSNAGNKRIQKFISEFSAPFTQPYNFDKLVSHALFELREFATADRTIILELQTDGSMFCTYENIINDKMPKALNRSLAYETMKPILDKADKTGFFYEKSAVPILQEYPEISFGEKSFCYIPLTINGNKLGYLALFKIFEQANWTDDEIKLVSMAASILAGAFSMRRSEYALKEATRKAQQANIAKSIFLSNMSHEIRTPMNAILGMAQIAEKTSDTSKLRKCIETIKDSSNQLLSIINDVLDISKIESGKLELNDTVFSLERTIMKSCSLVMAKANDKGIKIQIDTDANLRLCYRGDDLRISQILANYLSNAVKFTPEGGTILVTAGEMEQMDENKIRIHMAVEDNGIGMTKEQLLRIFNSFEQADGSISRQYGGTGLGLAIAKGLAEKMGGSVGVKSGHGRGSKFTVDLLVKCADKEDAELCNHIRTQFGGWNVLIISNSCSVTSKLSSLINRFGLYCDTTDHFAGAAALAQKAIECGRPYRAVFFDFNMHSTESLRIYPSLEKIVGNNGIILITEHGMQNSLKKEMEQYGIKRNLEMPLFAAALYDTLTGIVPDKKINRGRMPGEAVLDFSNVTVLLAEDVDINRIIFTSLLEDTGIHIDCAENGIIAVEMFHHSPDKYDIIVMDIQMPRMNGLEATRAIRALGFSHAQTVPIIAMTANAFKEDADECIAAGMNDHVAKPIGFDTLQTILKKWIPKVNC